MKDMLASQLDDRLLAESLNIANHAVGVCIVSVCELFIFGDAILM